MTILAGVNKITTVLLSMRVQDVRRLQSKDLMLLSNEFSCYSIVSKSDCKGKDLEEFLAPDWYVDLEDLKYMNKEVRVYLFKDQSSSVIPENKVKGT